MLLLAAWQADYVGLGERFRQLDNKVMGRPVPDSRNVVQRVLRPPFLSWSRTGRVVYVLTVLAFFGLLRWAGDEAWTLFAMVGLFVAVLIVLFSEERKRSRAFHRDHDSTTGHDD